MPIQRIVKDYNVRRLEFLSATNELIFSVGYRRMSVAMLTQKVGVAKGTFYHYFRSKEDLLAQWVFHLLSPAIEQNKQVVQDDSMNALEKLNKILRQGRDWDLEHLDMMITLMTIMYDVDNVLFLAEMTKQAEILTKDIFASILIEGAEEGLFDLPYPQKVATRLIKISHLFSQDFGVTLIRHIHHGDVTIEELQDVVFVWQDIVERILGVPRNSILFVDDTFLKTIFAHIEASKKIKITA